MMPLSFLQLTTYIVLLLSVETTMTPDGPETSGESEKSEESRASGLPTEPITGTSEESWESEESGASRLPTESITGRPTTTCQISQAPNHLFVLIIFTFSVVVLWHACTCKITIR